MMKVVLRGGRSVGSVQTEPTCQQTEQIEVILLTEETEPKNSSVFNRAELVG